MGRRTVLGGDQGHGGLVRPVEQGQTGPSQDEEGAALRSGVAGTPKLLDGCAISSGEKVSCSMGGSDLARWVYGDVISGAPNNPYAWGSPRIPGVSWLQSWSPAEVRPVEEP